MRECGYYVKIPVSYFYHIFCRSSCQWIHRVGGNYLTLRENRVETNRLRARRGLHKPTPWGCLTTGAARRTRVEMYEIKIGQTRKFLITVSPQKELLWKVKCQQPLWVPESNGDTGGDWGYVTLWHIHIMPALWYKLNLNGKSLSDSNLAFLSILFIQYIILGNGSSNHLEFTYNLLVSCHVFRHFIHKTT